MSKLKYHDGVGWKQIAPNMEEFDTIKEDLVAHKADIVTDSDGVHGLKIEEGIFTPTINDVSNNQPTVYSNQKGFYYKIGNTVMFHLYLGITTKGAIMSGDLTIKGLPFAPKNTSGRFTSPNIGYADKVNIGVGKTLNCFLNPTSSFISLGVASNDGTLQRSVTAAMVSDGTALMVSGQYQI